MPTQPLLHYPVPTGGDHILTDRPLAVVDVETTGFSPGPDRIVEVAVVRVGPTGTVEDRWTSLVDPGRDVGPTWVHQVTNDMVLGAPAFGDIAGEVVDRLSGAVVVAHNAGFDEGFLAAEFDLAGIALPTLPGLCTMTLARSVLPAPNYKLATCCEVLGLTNHAAHNALGDAEVTAELAVHLIRKAPNLQWRQPTIDVSAPGHHAAAHLRPVP